MYSIISYNNTSLYILIINCLALSGLTSIYSKPKFHKNVMEPNQWNFNVEKNCLTLSFKDPLIENTYRGIRESKVYAYYPKIIVFLICLVVFLRRLMLLIESYYGLEGVQTCREMPLTIVSVACFILESITLGVSKFSLFRCTFLIISSFYYTADSSISYYITRVTNEPVYAFG